VDNAKPAEPDVRSTPNGRRAGLVIGLASAAVVVFAASYAFSQEATKALVNVIVAEQFCGINAPTDLARFIATNAMNETGMNGQQLTQAGYAAAGEIGRAYANDGTLGTFCQTMAKAFFAPVEGQ
jgi:hypothetical protein